MAPTPLAHFGTLAREAGGEVRAILRQRTLHRPAPPATGLVLDVGSGQAPDPRADVVVDKYPVDNFERGAASALDFTKPLIVADGAALPFADGAFAYVIASHVLEHAEDPVAFAAELSRVAPRGFVQVPSRDSELVYSWPFHPWLIALDDGVLVFTPKPDAPIPGSEAAHAAYGESLLARLAWAAHRSRWHHSVHWTGTVPVRVEGEREAHDQASLDVTATVQALTALGRAGNLAPLPPAVRDTLRCPACRSALTWADSTTTCAGCGLSYPVAAGVPLLLAEAAVDPAAPPA